MNKINSGGAFELPEADALNTAPVLTKRVLVCLDASDHANCALNEAIAMAKNADGIVTGIHAYAAKLHDRRFRQMEGGLPERYRKEEEMEKQRDVHDDLITRGLNLISESYHDTGQKICDEAGVDFKRLSPEGKNYRRIVEAANSGDFDVLVLGALGLGRVPGAMIGTVCERTVRRSDIETLVIRDPERKIGDGPLVVGVDGSPRSFGVLMTALEIARRTGAKIHAIAVYDPYFHYVAFDKIADALSKEASEEFKFKEQEKLHEEIIDSGIARIYQSHLDIARSVAEDEGVEIVTELLEGKPYQAIEKYINDNDASLLLMGKTGVHADPDLDIGGNSENLLRNAPCSVWFGQSVFTPPFDAIARETITWTQEAEQSLEKVPEQARSMVRIAILRFAQESGHTVVTKTLIEEATMRFCPDRGGKAQEETTMAWTEKAKLLLQKTGDPTMVASIRLKAEKCARRENSNEVAPEHVRPFIDDDAAPAPVWSAAALARISRVPEMMRSMVRRRIEASAAEAGLSEITLEFAEEAIAKSRRSMQSAMLGGGHKLQ